MAQTVQVAHGQGVGQGTGHGGGEHLPTSTGIDSRKMLMWTFLASDCMFFGSLIATYLVFRGRSEAIGKGPFPANTLDIPYTSISAFVLLMSSLTMVLALGAIQRGDYRGFRAWLLGTAFLGCVFLGGQFFEFSSFHNEGLGMSTNMFGASFFTLTGFHGAHVTVGVIMLLSLFIISLRGGVRQDQSINVEIIALYWHFVDIVWIIIFTVVYLLPYKPAPEKAAGAFFSLSALGDRLFALGHPFLTAGQQLLALGAVLH